jgi:hypothetical protein
MAIRRVGIATSPEFATSMSKKKTLGVWPALPIVIWDIVDFTSDEDNTIVALEHRDRVCEIKLEGLTISQSEELLPFMRESFPALTKLQIESYSHARDEPGPVLPDSFCPTSTFPPFGIYFISSITESSSVCKSPRPSLPLLYSYGVHFTRMVAALSALTKLEDMHLFFRYPDSDSDIEDRPPLPLTRSVLPALKWLGFQ